MAGPLSRCAHVVRLTACARTAGLLACSGRLQDCVGRGDVFGDAGQEACGPRVHDSPDPSRTRPETTGVQGRRAPPRARAYFGPAAFFRAGIRRSRYQRSLRSAASAVVLKLR